MTKQTKPQGLTSSSARNRFQKLLKSLEKRLLDINLAIEQERSSRPNLDDLGPYHHLIEQRDLIRLQIQSLQETIQSTADSAGGSQNAKKNEVHIGSTVKVENGQVCHYLRMVEPAEANPRRGFVSHDSPLGQAISDRRVGDRVIVETPAGKVDYRIREIA